MKKVTALIDMDGVLVNWLDAIRKFAGLPESAYDVFRTSPHLLDHDSIDLLFGGRDNLKKLSMERPAEWWINLEFFPWADCLVRTMQKNFDVAFLTSPGNCPISAQAKLQWQKMHYPEIPMLVGRHKYLVASETKALIDDDEWQLSRFDIAGGLAIKWPNQFELEKHPLDVIKEVTIGGIVQRIKDHEVLINQ